MNKKKTIKIAIVDDMKISRDTTRMYFRNDDEIEVVFDSDSGEKLFQKLKENKVDQILMDVRMDVMDGIETTREVKRIDPNIKVIAYTVYCDITTKIKMAEAGISSFISKDSGILELRKAIYEVHKNDIYYTEYFPKVLHENIFKPDNKGIFPVRENLLSIEEIKLIKVLCEGKRTSLEMAQKLHLDQRTFERHKKDILEKTKTGDVVNLVKYAIQNGIIPLYNKK